MISPSHNPLRIQRRREILTWAVTLPILAVATLWALRPVSNAPITIPSIEPRAAGTAPASSPEAPQIDHRVFAVNLWNPPPPPAQPQQAASESKPPPLKLELLGIITDDSGTSSVTRAALYDVEQDRLLIVTDGERIRDQTLRIGPDRSWVELTDGRATRRLSLRPDREAPS